MMRTTAGIRLKREQLRQAFCDPVQDLWFELDAQDYMTAGERDLSLLQELRSGGLRISLHDAGMSLAATARPDAGRLLMSARAMYAGLRGDFTGHRRFLR